MHELEVPMSRRSHDPHTGPGNGHPYRRLAAMAALSFIAMFTLMYAMVDRLPNMYPNLNQVYMAGLMTAPMVIIEILVMRSMYAQRKLNAAILGGSAVLLVALLVLIRRQTAISDHQFLMSMIPHHGGAILMCQQSSLRDPALRTLCEGIVASQQQEIEFMKARLARGRSE
jgi:hypothetical protein